MRLCHSCRRNGLTKLSAGILACPECDWYADWPRTAEMIREAADELERRWEL